MGDEEMVYAPIKRKTKKKPGMASSCGPLGSVCKLVPHRPCSLELWRHHPEILTNFLFEGSHVCRHSKRIMKAVLYQLSYWPVFLNILWQNHNIPNPKRQRIFASVNGK